MRALLSRLQVPAACYQSSALSSLSSLSCDAPAWQYMQPYSSTQRSDPTGTEAATSAASNDSSSVGTAAAGMDGTSLSTRDPHKSNTQADHGMGGHASQQHESISIDDRESYQPAGQHSTRHISSGFAVQPQQHTRGSSISTGDESFLPQETLHIQLRQEVKPEDTRIRVDAYSLSRSLVHDQTQTHATASNQQQLQQKQQQQQLTAADKDALEKLVGILTKDGKKSRARRLLLDAMHIMKQQLSKRRTTA